MKQPSSKSKDALTDTEVEQQGPDHADIAGDRGKTAEAQRPVPASSHAASADTGSEQESSDRLTQDGGSEQEGSGRLVQDAGSEQQDGARQVQDASEEGVSPDSEEGASPKKDKKSKGRKERKNDRKAASDAVLLGTTRGVETMFRNAFRTEMELLALAATKANIMISLNGFIVSALMVSGAFVFAASPEFLIPAGTFMVTAAISIVFALLSASPDRAGRVQAIWEWFSDLRKGRARLRDFRARVMPPEGHFFGDQPNILIYEDRVKIPKDRYWEMMKTLMGDRERVYHQMSDELYWLGLMADKQFKYLHASYRVFRWGLVASVIAFIGVKGLPAVVPAIQADRNAEQLKEMGIHSFSGVYEPSAVQQLPDGRVLVVEDEADHAVSVLSFGPDGTLVEEEMSDQRLMMGFKRKLNDLEGLARDPEGRMYAITSHARNKSGQRRPNRELLMRFRIQGTQVRELAVFNRLTDVLEKSEQLQNLLKARVGSEVPFTTINIEGLAYDPENKRLVLGFRDPKVNDTLSIVAFIDNPDAVFESDADPHFDDLAVLDLGGGGIRSINYDPVLNAYVIANEVRDTDGSKYSQLWRWSGQPLDDPQMIDVPNLWNLTNVEAVESVEFNGQRRLLLMADEGDAAKGQPAKYMLLDYKDL